jgi:hypothetical protein
VPSRRLSPSSKPWFHASSYSLSRGVELFDGKPRQLGRIRHTRLTDIYYWARDLSRHGVIAVAQPKGLEGQLIGFG